VGSGGALRVRQEDRCNWHRADSGPGRKQTVCVTRSLGKGLAETSENMVCAGKWSEDVGTLETAAPEAVGLNTDKLNDLMTWLEEMKDENKLPMVSMLVAKKGKVVFYGGVGEAAPGKEIQPDSLYRIFSMTKPLTSLSLLMLMEEGKVQLDDPVHKYLGDMWRPENKTIVDEEGGTPRPSTVTMTVKHLLNHTSGLCYGFFPSPVAKYYNEATASLEGTNPTTAEQVESLATVPLLYEPGEKWSYSCSTDVVGRLVEVISGMSLGDFFKDRLFLPLGMMDTSFVVPNEKLDRLVNAKLLTPKGIIDITANEEEKGSYREGSRQESGGGGLVSSMQDYAKFCQFCMNQGELNGKRLIKKKTFALATTNSLPGNKLVPELTVPYTAPLASPGRAFGLGFAVQASEPSGDFEDGTSQVNKGVIAWGGAAGTKFICDPKEDMYALFYTQVIGLQFSALPRPNDFPNKLYQALQKDSFTTEPVSSRAPASAPSPAAPTPAPSGYVNAPLLGPPVQAKKRSLLDRISSVVTCLKA